MKKRTLAALVLGLLGMAACGRAPEAPFGTKEPQDKPAAASQARRGLKPGFKLSVYAEGLGRARFMAFGPDTRQPDAAPVLYVTAIREGQILALPDRDGDGRADDVIRFAEGLSSPHGLAWREGWLYVGETHRVVRFRDTDGDGRADQKEVVVANLPDSGQHFTRTVGFGPDGKLYVSVGSSCNACKEADKRRAAILRFNPDGSGMEIHARGLRNAVGFTWNPTTQEMWATDNGRDWLGDDLPPDELDLIRRGGDYGWPYCYGNRLPDPDLGSAARCASTQPATFEMQAHSAPLGLDFYTGAMFPEEYRGDLFIAFHGSWNRSAPTGYKVVRVRFREGQPVKIEDFVDVWVEAGQVRHRPVDVKTGPDGALYISDDHRGTVFRLTYSK